MIGTQLTSTTRVREVSLASPKVFGSQSRVGHVRELLLDDHVHAALIVHRGKLLTVIESADIPIDVPDDFPAKDFGRLVGRTVRPDARAIATLELMRSAGRRRLAVIDVRGNLLGLLCMKRNMTGFCSEADVRAREMERNAGVTLPALSPTFSLSNGAASASAKAVNRRRLLW
jgi:hypothetical protein